jgi:hypothetical protein
MKRSIINMDKAHEKMWLKTKSYYTDLIKSNISDEEKSWYERRVRSCDNLLNIFKIS